MDRSSDGPEVIYQEIFCNQRRKKGSTISDILRKPQTGCQSANRSIFIACLKQVKGVKNIEPSENQSLSGIVHRHVVPELVIEVPVTVRQRSRTCHNFKCQFIFLKQFFVFRI